MSQELISQYEQGCDLALEVIKMAAIDDRKAIAVSLLNNLCSPVNGEHCATTQGIRDVARDFINGGSIPAWMEYEPLVAA
jgi:hypothetical protein